jgi:hypothetical protein
MKINKFVASTIVASATGLLSVQAQNLNGTLNSGFYGSALTVQTINTGFGNAAGGNDSTGGSELDAAYGKVSGGNVYLFFAGNFENNGNHLNVFVGGGASGQSTLNTSGGTLSAMNGSVFSSGFSATFAFDMNDYGGTLYSEEYNLVANTGGYVGSLGSTLTGIYAGSSGGSGVSSLYLNNNHASTMGSGGAALSGATSGINTTTGLELVVPLAAIGYTGGNIEVFADINGGGDTYLSNQLLPGQPVGTGNLGTSTFNNPGYFTVPVPEPTTLALLGLSGLATFAAVRRRK